MVYKNVIFRHNGILFNLNNKRKSGQVSWHILTIPVAQEAEVRVFQSKASLDKNTDPI
jgi:hypothetical protein